MCVSTEPTLMTNQKRASDPITQCCKPPCGCQELNSGLLEEHSGLLTSQPSLQAKSLLFNANNSLEKFLSVSEIDYHLKLTSAGFFVVCVWVFFVFFWLFLFFVFLQSSGLSLLLPYLLLLFTLYLNGSVVIIQQNQYFVKEIISLAFTLGSVNFSGHLKTQKYF